METNIQFGLPLNHFLFYLIIFLSTACYYGFIYYKSKATKFFDERTIWYRKNNAAVKVLLFAFTLIITLGIIIWLFLFGHYLQTLKLSHILLASIFPVASLMYISAVSPIPFLQKIRRFGWLKPFIVGFTWSGIVTIYPLLFLSLTKSEVPVLEFETALFWFQNFLFISALAIIFDMKDYNADLQNKLLTYPAKLGILKTFTRVILPVTLLSLGFLFYFLWLQHADFLQFSIQIIPYFLLLILCINFKKSADVLFYLVAVDGLMLVKALCGIASIKI